MTKVQRQIIALGGGGFSMEPENPALDLYILEQARTPRPAVCFLSTASGDADRYIVNFYTAFSQFDCHPSHLGLFQRTPDLRSFLLAQDVIYVGGGNTKSMLAVWREWGLPEVLQEAWEAGIVLAGLSAGAICWFEQGITDSVAGKLTVLNCLGFLSGSCCPHYDGESERRPAFHEFLLRGEISPGYALDDGAAVHFRGETLYNVVASRAEARAYRLQAVEGSVVEEPLPVNYVNNNDGDMVHH
ncbi:MAG: type 1 glutamine amidotransferase-like domain-containing protein [Phycisphaerae bacterium]|nr:type 1 glutamine amidotransferase-like domain-containing protein [Phycisphaerae bacterium]